LPEAKKIKKQKSLDFYIWFLVCGQKYSSSLMQNKRMKQMQNKKIVSISYFKNLKELMVFMKESRKTGALADYLTFHIC
jgi:hypothetical protein